MTILNNMLFWTCVILCVISVYKMYLSKRLEEIQPREFAISLRTYRILLVLAFLTAIFVRMYRFGMVPGGFNQDGAMAAVDAKALSDYGTDRFGMFFPVHLTAWGYGQMSSLLSYLMIPFIRIFGFSPFAVRLPMLVVSLVGLGCLYGFTCDVFGKNIGLLVFWFASVNPWHILQSRWALDCNLYSHFFIIGIFLLHKALMGKWKNMYLAASMIVFGLSMYCYGISIYTMPLFLLAACIYLLVSGKLKIKNVVFAAAVYLLVAWPFIMVMAINFFRWDTIHTPLFTLPYFSDSIRSNDILFFSQNILSQLVLNFKSLLRVTALQTKDLPWNDVQNFGTMYLFSFPFAVAGLCGLLYEFRKRAGAVLLFLFLCTGIWCGLVTNSVNVNRLNMIYYSIILLAGIGIYEVIRWMAMPYLKYGIAAAYIVVFVLFVRVYFTTYSNEIGVLFNQDFGAALSSLKESEAEKFYITVGYQQNVAITEILTLFWCEIDAEYFQGKISLDELPYKEKYTFDGMRNITIEPSENAVYIITAEELVLFDDSLYEFEQFGRYYRVGKR